MEIKRYRATLELLTQTQIITENWEEKNSLSLKEDAIKKGDQITIEFYDIQDKNGAFLNIGSLFIEVRKPASTEGRLRGDAWGGPLGWEGVTIKIIGTKLFYEGSLIKGDSLDPQGYPKVTVYYNGLKESRLKEMREEGFTEVQIADESKWYKLTQEEHMQNQPLWDPMLEKGYLTLPKIADVSKDIRKVE